MSVASLVAEKIFLTLSSTTNGSGIFSFPLKYRFPGTDLQRTLQTAQIITSQQSSRNDELAIRAPGEDQQITGARFI